MSMRAPGGFGARRAALAGCLALTTLLALPAGATAAGLVTIVNSTPPTQRIQFTDQGGDTNNITITQAGTTFTITDAGAVINEPVPECTGGGTNTVVCTDPDIVGINATLGPGSDRIVNDTLVASSFLGGPGADSLTGSNSPTAGVENLSGGTEGDTIVGRAGLENISGDEGVDDLSAGPGSDTLDGGEDADRVDGGDDDDQFLGDRDDASDQLIGGAGDDSFTITVFPFGPDQGDDVMDGGPGVDDVSMEDFTFLFSGEPSAPARVTLNDTAANDGFGDQANSLRNVEDVSTTSTGGGDLSGDDVIIGSGGGNLVQTFDGDDFVDALAGPDVIAVGNGDDTVEARDGSRDRIDCADGSDTVRADQFDALADCENVRVSRVLPAAVTPRYPLPPPTLAECAGGRLVLTLGAARDVRLGTAGNDLIFAGTGDDVVDALAGDDCIDLGPGNDRGQGGAGNDLLVGGLGLDQVVGSTGNDRLRGDAGDDRLEGGTGNDDLLGGSGNDSLAGGGGGDRLHGQAGNDSIAGAGGDERINGGSGRDRISGGSGRERIAGDAGNDRISGGSGRDVLRGNSGADRISGRDGSRDHISCGTGRDSVTADRRDVIARDCERRRVR